MEKFNPNKKRWEPLWGDTSVDLTGFLSDKTVKKPEDNLERIEKKYREENKEDVCRGRRLSDEESQAALTREQIEQQKAIRDMEKYLDREDKE